jgi:hypothetical protein
MTDIDVGSHDMIQKIDRCDDATPSAHLSEAWLAPGVIVLVAALAFGTAAAACAQTPAGESEARASEVGHATRAWLDLQRSNTAAAPAMPMLGAEAGLAYQRYLDSFKNKIPGSFGSTTQSDSGALHVDYTNASPASQGAN